MVTLKIDTTEEALQAMQKIAEQENTTVQALILRLMDKFVEEQTLP